MTERMMTMNELADYLQVTRDTIYYWRKRGRGPKGYRMGRHVRFRRSEVDAWIEQARDAEPVDFRSGLPLRP